MSTYLDLEGAAHSSILEAEAANARIKRGDSPPTVTKQEELYPIETGIPIPDWNPLAPDKSVMRLRMEALKCGQSFFVPLDAGHRFKYRRNSNRLNSHLQSMSKNVRNEFPRRVFVARKLSHEGVVGIRLWRADDKDAQ